jgi:hypothetical protein
LIEAGRAAGLDIKIVENDPNDPIHDTSCRGGLGKFNCERTAFNMHHALQFFHAHADELGLKYVSTEYSEEHPLDIAVVWQDLKLPDIAQSLNNIQECNASYIYYICLRLFDLFFMFGIYICPHYYIDDGGQHDIDPNGTLNKLSEKHRQLRGDAKRLAF